jgi:hypothetical protein
VTSESEQGLRVLKAWVVLGEQVTLMLQVWEDGAFRDVEAGRFDSLADARIYCRDRYGYEPWINDV